MCSSENTLASIQSPSNNGLIPHFIGKLHDTIVDSAIRGLDFLVRHQCKDELSADCGRFPIDYDCEKCQIMNLTGNWTTAVACNALMAGYGLTENKDYYDAALKSVTYLKSLQEFSPAHPRLQGVFHEYTPQSSEAFPRDALTAAWTLLDWSKLSDDEDSFSRAEVFANWFVYVAMEKGYPYWQVRFDDKPWNPEWCGSFHSGSAFFLAKMYLCTGKEIYRNAMTQILDHYNSVHLQNDGKINVIVDRSTLKSLDGVADLEHSNRMWETMHRYNDDFGTLSNLIAWQITKKTGYLDGARRFLKRMISSQRDDGGYGPGNFSVSSATGTVLLELLAARTYGLKLADDNVLEASIRHLLSLQYNNTVSQADGAFKEVDEHNNLQKNMFIRTHAYALITLLYAAGSDSTLYLLKPLHNCPMVNSDEI